jgi:hypothetical protein
MKGSRGQPCAACHFWRIALGAAVLAFTVTFLVTHIQ